MIQYFRGHPDLISYQRGKESNKVQRRWRICGVVDMNYLHTHMLVRDIILFNAFRGLAEKERARGL